jgi:hypothetical protein
MTIENDSVERLIKSRQRIADHGEVFTPAWLVSDMLELVGDEAERVDARFLDPACGSGNFLVPVLERKLAAVEDRHGRGDVGRRHAALAALMCVYGIELLPDNAAECRENLLAVFVRFLGARPGDQWWRAAAAVLSANIVQGDALAMTDAAGRHLAFPEWHRVGGGFRRRNLRLDELARRAALRSGFFDVVVGNPPFQLAGAAGGTSDASIYHLFVEQAQRLGPRFVSMVVPSRWMAGGRGVARFRRRMLGERRLRRLVDFPVSREVFPGVEVKGGVGYFLWQRDYDGRCEVSITRGGSTVSAHRDLDEFDVLVRHPRAVRVLKRVLAVGEEPITSILARDTPFGIATNFSDHHPVARPGDVPLYYTRRGMRGIGHLADAEVRKNRQLIGTWKLLAPKAGSDGGQRVPDVVLGRPWLAPSPSVCTQSFLFFHVDSEAAAMSLRSYYATKLFRFLVSLRKLTQDALHSTYAWVPVQSWDREWTDAELYAKYGLTAEEIAFVESQIAPMTLG